MTVAHPPQTKYSRNIIAMRRALTPAFIPRPSAADTAAIAGGFALASPASCGPAGVWFCVLWLCVLWEQPAGGTLRCRCAASLRGVGRHSTSPRDTRDITTPRPCQERRNGGV